MIIAAMIAYYVFAIGFLALVGYLTARHNVLKFRRAVDAAIARMEAKHPLEKPSPKTEEEEKPSEECPVEPAATSAAAFAPVPDLFITIRRLEGSSLQNLPPFAAAIIEKVSRLEEAEGGRGVQFDAYGSREEKDKLVLRLLPRLSDAEVETRLAKVSEVLNTRASEAREHTSSTNEVFHQIENATFSGKR